MKIVIKTTLNETESKGHLKKKKHLFDPQIWRLFTTADHMWLIALLVPLLPTIFMVSSHYCGIVSILCHQALAWALRLVGGEACVKSTHVFVFSNCTHGKGDSVLETFDLYAETHQSLCIGPQIGM